MRLATGGVDLSCGVDVTDTFLYYACFDLDCEGDKQQSDRSRAETNQR